MSEMYRQAVEAQTRPGGQHPYLPFPWAGEASRNGNGNRNDNGNGDGNGNSNITYHPFSCAAARSGNGLAGHPSQAGGGGPGQQAIQGRHGIVDPGPAASYKGRTAVLDPAGI